MACRKCGSKNLSDGGKCRPCQAAAVRRWVARNKEKKAQVDREYRLSNLEDVRSRSRERAKRNRSQNRSRSKKWYEANKERSKASCKVAADRRRLSDPAAFKAKRAAAARRLRASDPRRQLHEKVSRLVNKTLKRHRTSKQGKSWPDLVGYGLVDLENHLRSTLPSGFEWADYLSGRLEIDHIIPASVFNFQTPHDIDFKRCWSLSNLRLLTKEDNHKKRAKLFAPFQPALPLAVSRGAAV